MKILTLSLALLTANSLHAQFSIPAKPPILCSATCPQFLVTNGLTLVVVAKLANGLPMTINIGVSPAQTVKSDYMVPFTGMSVYHVPFTSLPPYTTGVTVAFPPKTGRVVLLLYEGIWAYSKGAEGDYTNANSAFPDCVNGGGCAYWWTQPIVPNRGDLLIAFADSNASGCGIFRPGPGWTIEATHCTIGVEDKIATVEAPDIGSMYASAEDGSDTGGSHWLMGVAVFKKEKP